MRTPINRSVLSDDAERIVDRASDSFNVLVEGTVKRSDYKKHQKVFDDAMFALFLTLRTERRF